MRSLPPVTYSETKEKLLEQIDSVHAAICAFYSEVPDNLILSRGEPEGWTALKNMRHIVSTNHMMSFWIRMPAGILRLMGLPRRPQQKVEDLVPTNRPHVKDHGCYRAGRFCRPERREHLLRHITASAQTLKRAVEAHSEAELDGLKGPFGGMSLRIFVHFVLKHNLYHTGVVRARLNA